MRLADLIIETFVLQATVARAQMLVGRGHATAAACARLYARDATPRIAHAAIEIIGRAADPSADGSLTKWVRQSLWQPPIDTIGLRREIVLAG